MTTALYKTNFERRETGVELSEKAFKFLEEFYLDFRQTFYYVDKEVLDGLVSAYKECGEVLPQELVDFLYKELEKNDDLVLITG